MLLYFGIAQNLKRTENKIFICFLATFILFLLARPYQQYLSNGPQDIILYIRMSIMFIVACPCLVIASGLHSGRVLLKRHFALPFIVGFVISALYIILHDVTRNSFLFAPEQLSFIPLTITQRSPHYIQIVGELILVVIPTAYLIFEKNSNDTKKTQFTFLSGVLLFGVLMIIGTVSQQWWIYYLGSLLCACLWIWAALKEIQELKGKATMLKEELQLLALNGDESSKEKMHNALEQLEDFSRDNIELYKVRVREVLCMLTDVSISAGADTEELISRNNELMDEIQSLNQTHHIHRVVSKEAIELTNIISQETKNNHERIVDKAQSFIENNYQNDIGVEAIADELRVSREHLTRLFKKYTGQTIRQYLTYLRIEKSKELLQIRSITDTAFSVGFNNSNYFSTVFKKEVGMTPGQFQKSL